MDTPALGLAAASHPRYGAPRAGARRLPRRSRRPSQRRAGSGSRSDAGTRDLRRAGCLRWLTPTPARCPPPTGSSRNARRPARWRPTLGPRGLGPSRARRLLLRRVRPVPARGRAVHVRARRRSATGASERPGAGRSPRSDGSHAAGAASAGTRSTSPRPGPRAGRSGGGLAAGRRCRVGSAPPHRPAATGRISWVRRSGNLRPLPDRARAAPVGGSSRSACRCAGSPRHLT